MGCDIHSYPEIKVDGVFRPLGLSFHPWTDGRSYAWFAFLAGVRNYSDILPISKPRGLPTDVSIEVKSISDGWDIDGHSHSWLSLKELQEFDYEVLMEDRRYTKQVTSNYFDGKATCAPGEGITQTWREFLGKWFFADLEKLKAIGADRVVFWFDN